MDKNLIIENAKTWCKKNYCFYLISNLKNSEDIFLEIGCNLAIR